MATVRGRRQIQRPVSPAVAVGENRTLTTSRNSDALRVAARVRFWGVTDSRSVGIMEIRMSVHIKQADGDDSFI